jgi:hypothetical protein
MSSFQSLHRGNSREAREEMLEIDPALAQIARSSRRAQRLVRPATATHHVRSGERLADMFLRMRAVACNLLGYLRQPRVTAVDDRETLALK